MRLPWPFRKQGAASSKEKSGDAGTGHPALAESSSRDAGKDGGSSPHAATTLRPGGTGGATHQAAVSGASPDLEDEPRYGLIAVVPQPADRAGCVDIIAIHGLNGHCHNTWKDPTTKLNWLKDEGCLRKDIPNARVMTFGYNSRTYFSQSDANVKDFASELLAAVKASRGSLTERQRPIVFLCHSLGGLVFKQAVVRAYDQNEYYSEILDNIRGVVFFGTPHRGSDLAFWDRIGTSLTRVGTFGYLTNTRLSRDLKVDAKMLQAISESFAYRGEKFMIRSFYETCRMKGLNCRVVEKQSATLGWPNELDIASPTDHSGICKFPSPSEPRYQTAIFAITELIGHADDEDAPFTSREEACMRELNSDYEQHLGQVDDAVPGTCEWVLSHEKWSRWAGLDGPSLLWITADAGCGKSVIAKFIVNHFISHQEAHPRTHLCYFFFKDGLEEQNNASAAIPAVLHQLCYSQRRLIKHAMAKYITMPTRNFTRFSSLWPILMAVMSDPAMRDVIWILDGLDECKMPSLDDLLKGLAAYFDPKQSAAWTSSARLRIILLSRPHNAIQRILHLQGKDEPSDGDELVDRDSRNMLRLMVEEEIPAVARDIELFTRFKVTEFGNNSGLPSKVLSRLKQRLISGADDTFLWISLVIKLVEDTGADGISMARLESILSTTKLDDLSEQLLYGMVLPLKTRKVLMIVLAAVRPLSIEELCAAVEVYQDYHHEASDDAQTRPRLASSTAKTITGGGVVRLTGSTGFGQAGIAEPTRDRGDDETSNPSSLAELDKLLHMPFSNHLRQICGHFLRIRSRRVYLVHQTARDFLLGRESRIMSHPFPPEYTQHTNPLVSFPEEDISGRNRALISSKFPHNMKVWRESIELEDANRYLLQVCVDYISLFKSDLGESRRKAGGVVEYLRACHRDRLRAFFRYAASHWVDHYRPVRQSSDFSLDYMLEPRSKLFAIWIIAHPSWMPEEERNLLEAGGIQIDHGSSNPDGVASFGVMPVLYSSIRTTDSRTRKLQEEVLDHFNLCQGVEEMESYDAEFLGGNNRYWKNEANLDIDLDEEGKEEDLSDNYISRNLPDRVRYYRQRHRKSVMQAFAEGRSGLSETGGNPASLYYGKKDSVLQSPGEVFYQRQVGGFSGLRKGDESKYLRWRSA